MLFLELLALQAREALQTHLQDGFGLCRREAEARDEARLRFLRVGAGADERNDLVDEVERLDEAGDEVVALLGLAQQVRRAARDDDLAVGDVLRRAGA